MVIKHLSIDGINNIEAEPLVFGTFLISLIVFICVGCLWICSDYPCFGRASHNNYNLTNDKYGGHNVILKNKTKENINVIINYNGKTYEAVK